MRKMDMRLCLPVAIAILFGGCASTDWEGRIESGAYTLDQLIKDEGIPDKTAELQDGSTVVSYTRFWSANKVVVPDEQGFARNFAKSYNASSRDRVSEEIYTFDERGILVGRSVKW